MCALHLSIDESHFRPREWNINAQYPSKTVEKNSGSALLLPAFHGMSYVFSSPKWSRTLEFKGYILIGFLFTLLAEKFCVRFSTEQHRFRANFQGVMRVKRMEKVFGLQARTCVLCTCETEKVGVSLFSQHNIFSIFFPSGYNMCLLHFVQWGVEGSTFLKLYFHWRGYVSEFST